MKVHVLGSGTCFPARGIKRRAHPGFFIRWGEGDQHLLLDCSANIAERLEDIGEKPNKIRHMAISHAHPDHCCLQGFLQTCLCHEMWEPGFSWDNKDAFPHLNLYAPKHIIEHVPTLNAFHFEGEGEKGLPFPVLTLRNMTRSDRLMHAAALNGPGEWVESIPVSHDNDKADALAFRITANGKVVAYSGDAGFDRGSDTSAGLLRVADGSDLFICEASAQIGNEQSARTYGHLNPRQAGEIARDARAERLMLTHYSGVDSGEAMIADCRSSGFQGEIIIAKDNDVYEV